ncbi:MAG: phosphoribosylanthranilate isomerase [Magnetococcus sp. DMHC-6]
MGRVRIKICGITRKQDAYAAFSSGADALGFVFFSKSPRNISPKAAAQIVEGLPPFVTVVGLFVNATQKQIRDVMSIVPLDVIQLHGDETPKFCRDLLERDRINRVVKAVRVASRTDLEGLERFPVNALLLDAKVAEHYGGTGVAFDWSLMENVSFETPIILAGGLDPDNVGRAIHRIRPYAVDVSSGVELSPGIKDAVKMERFIRAVRKSTWEEAGIIQ